VENFRSVPARRWIRALTAAFLLLALGAGAAGAASGDLTTTITSQTTTATSPTSTAVPTTTAVATTTTTTTAQAPATATTTATVPATTAAPAPQPATTAAAEPTCPPVGGLAVLRPHRPALTVGPSVRAPAAAGGSLRYPSDGAVVQARVATGTGCGVSLDGLSLFGGAIQVDSLSIGVRDGSPVPAIGGVRIGGQAVAPPRGSVMPVGTWAIVGALPVLVCPSMHRQQGALAVHLLKARAGLPAGTTLLFAFASSPSGGGAPLAMLCAGVHKRALDRNERLHLPLTITPPLGRHLKYVFPVAANVGVFDTYGALRSDVPGGWHHGDDIFAPIGTPLVAVADGTLNRVGWNKTGGWRLWVRDNVGDQFYYAHLSGYTPLALERGSVRAGDVLGFVGDSGDAIMTPPHLHFEVHPRSLLFLKYDGAVDPTSYLQAWPHLAVQAVPKPVIPRLPRGPARMEAAKLYRRLLVIRGYRPKHRPAPAAQPVAAAPTVASVESPIAHSAHVGTASASRSGWLLGGPLGVLLVLGATAAVYLRRRRSGMPAVAFAEPEMHRPVLPAVAAARRGSTTHALVRIGIVLLASSTAVAAVRASRTDQGARETA
jgi:Peptidase family M23